MAEKKEAPKKKKKPPKTYKGKSLKLGGGGRFQAGVDKLTKQGKSPEQAKAIMGQAGRAKYGAKKMAGFSKQGKARAKKKK